MSRVCEVTGKGPIVGNKVSHANNKTKRRFLPNIQEHRFWDDEKNVFVKLKVSVHGMRIVDKLGVAKVLKMIQERNKKERTTN